MEDNNWHEHYKGRINSRYQRYFEFRYHPFLNYILQQKEKSIFELGCGIGSVTKYLSNYEINCRGIDISLQMVALANQNVNEITWRNQLNPNPFSQGDILAPPRKGTDSLTLGISHGVLEHFNDIDILKILDNYPFSIHYVPLDGYKTPSYGDERLLPKKHWIDLLNPVEHFTFNDGKDLVFKIDTYGLSKPT